MKELALVSLLLMASAGCMGGRPTDNTSVHGGGTAGETADASTTDTGGSGGGSYVATGGSGAGGAGGSGGDARGMGGAGTGGTGMGGAGTGGTGMGGAGTGGTGMGGATGAGGVAGSGGAGSFTISVTVVGTGTVTSVPAGISCPGTCSATIAASSVTLQARTTNGSDSVFTGWSDPQCAGPMRDCTRPLGASPLAITATFSSTTANLIFTTSATFQTNLGGTAPYDTACNTVATAAGLNNSGGNAYVAVISDTQSNVIARLGSARGWVRLDGKPFADTKNALFANNQVFYPILFQEDGQRHNGNGFITGTNPDGTAAPANCQNWTSTTDDGTIVSCGDADGGPYAWTSGSGSYCGLAAPLICMGKAKSSVVSIPAPPGPGRKIWLTSTQFTPNATTTPDAQCQAARPAGVTAAAAIISTTSRTADSVLDAATTYYRLDGVPVGTGADIDGVMPNVLNHPIASGIWQSEDGLYPIFNADGWTGSTALNVLGTTAWTCGDWKDPTQGPALYGMPQVTSSEWWSPFTSFSAPCNQSMRLYCVQTAP